MTAAPRSATVAAVQATPVFLDRTATIERTVGLIEGATAEGAELIVFPEAFVPGYPDWVWRTRAWDQISTSFYRRLLEESVDVRGPALAPVASAARAGGAYVVLGVNERDGSTLYNSLVYLGPDGDVLGVHRKLMPTGGERLVWGNGDGSGLVSVDTPFGRVGGLVCWENYMPLARAALYADGVDIFVAPTWDNSDIWVPTLRHIAREGRVHVIGTNSLLRGSDVPAADHGAEDIYGGDDDWMSRGNSAIVGPHGDLLAGPLVGEAGILYATVDAAAARATRQQFDPVGHYARADVFHLTVDRRAKPFAHSTPPGPTTHPVTSSGNRTLVVLDQGTSVSISFDDLLKYHGTNSIAGVAHAFKAMERAFPLLSPGRPPERSDLTVDSGFPGEGARDAFEMVTRAATDDRYRLAPLPAGSAVPEAPGGHFFFRLGYRGAKVDLTLRDGLVPEEFLQLACREAPTEGEADRAQQLKAEMAERLLSLPPDEVYDVRLTTGSTDPGTSSELPHRPARS